MGQFEAPFYNRRLPPLSALGPNWSGFASMTAPAQWRAMRSACAASSSPPSPLPRGELRTRTRAGMAGTSGAEAERGTRDEGGETLFQREWKPSGEPGTRMCGREELKEWRGTWDGDWRADPRWFRLRCP